MSAPPTDRSRPLRAGETTAGLRGTRVLVTGGAGMVGSHVVRLLTVKGARVTVLDRSPEPSDPAPANEAVRFVAADIRDHLAVAEAVAGNDVVVHLAALLSAAAASDPVAAIEVNVDATRMLLSAVARSGVRRIVIGSSVSVYGEPVDGAILRESSPTATTSLYGKSKLAAESLSSAVGAAHGFGVAVLRLGTLYSESLRAAGFHVEQLASVRAQLQAGRRLVDVDGDPDEVLDLLYAGDAADAIALAVAANVDLTVNVVSGVPVTWREVVDALLTANGLDAAANWTRTRRNWAAARRFDGSRARSELGFTASTPLADGMRLVANRIN